MNVIELLFITAPLLLLLAFFWATRNPAKQTVTPELALSSLAEKRDLHRLPQVLKALDPQDTQFLDTRGKSSLRKQLMTERRRIVLRYVDRLQNDFETLLEASRALAVMSPEVQTMQELERLKLSLRFAMLCRILRLKLKLGAAPWKGFGSLSDLACALSMQLEAATAKIAEMTALER